MNRLLAVLALCAVCGCQSHPDKTAQCERFQQVYTAYQASLAVHVPSNDERNAATAAALFLAAHCGWTPQLNNASDVRDFNAPVCASDAWGVPIVMAP